MCKDKTAFSPKALKTFLKGKEANGAEFTMVSKKTGKDYTYSISVKEFNGKNYIHIYVERQYMDFYHLGCYSNGKLYKKKEEVTSEAAKAIGWVLQRVESDKFDVLNGNIEFLHLGKCIRCGKTLTDAESIERGLGSTCAGK